MQEKDAFDILLDYPKKHHLDYDTNISNKRFFLYPSDPLLNTKFVIFKKNNLFFLAYDSFGTKAYTSRTFTGLYGLIDLPPETEFHFYKKEWIDNVLRMNKQKTGNSFIDKNITITSKSKQFPKKLISNDVVNHFLNLYSKICPLDLIVEHDYVSLIKELKGKMIIGIETNKWIYEESDLDNFLEHGNLLLNSIIKNACT